MPNVSDLFFNPWREVSEIFVKNSIHLYFSPSRTFFRYTLNKKLIKVTPTIGRCWSGLDESGRNKLLQSGWLMWPKFELSNPPAPLCNEFPFSGDVELCWWFLNKLWQTFWLECKKYSAGAILFCVGHSYDHFCSSTSVLSHYIKHQVSSTLFVGVLVTFTLPDPTQIFYTNCLIYIVTILCSIVMLFRLFPFSKTLTNASQ